MNQGDYYMKKRTFIFVVSIFTTLFLIAGGIQAEKSIQKTTTRETPQTTHISIQFSSPRLKEQDGSATVLLDEATGYRNIPGEPILPTVIETLELPFGSTVRDIHCSFSWTADIPLTQRITPASKPVVCATEKHLVQPSENTEVYSRDQLFPMEWYSYRLTGGLNSENILKTFLTIQINPVRYNPIKNMLTSIDSISLEVVYEPPSHPFSPASDDSDMIIICKDSYASLLEPLVAHKNSYGIQTKLITLSEIFSAAFFPAEGRDNQEKIKYFIKNAKETWNISFVMLVGNYVQVPIRYSNLVTDEGGKYEERKFASDLYYADLYTANGSFSSWDTDGDNVFAEWPYPDGRPPEDLIDMVPDVHVGRLACMFKTEVKTLVRKIISYENTAAGHDWFHRMVVAGGDTFEKSWEGGTDYNEGEVATAKALEYMVQFIPVTLWTSYENLTTENIHTEINKGCGFLYFCGHGSPKSWATHVNGDYRNWTGNYRLPDIRQLTNTEQSPILMVGGCHNSEFDTTPWNFILGLLTEKQLYFAANETWLGSYFKYNYALECWSWVFVKVAGGAMASIGSSGYGGVSIGDYNHDSIPDCIQGSDGWFEVEFFRLYNQENVTILGQTYDQVVTGYIQNFPVESNRYDAKIVQTHILLGDPSLKIGGYTQ